jgi:Fic family protein
MRTAGVGAKIFGRLSSEEKLIVNYLAEFEKISVSQTQRLTGFSWPAARTALGRLVEIGILDHIHKKGAKSDPGARFVLKPHPPDE